MADPRQRLRIIALGDPNRGDDAIGIVAARRLRDRLAAWVPIDEQTGEAGALIDSWQGAETVIVIDAIRSGAPAGTLHRYDARRHRLPIQTKPCTSHGLGLAEAVELARAMGQLPPGLLIFGIELKQCDLGRSMSPEIGNSIEPLLVQIEREVLITLSRSCTAP